MNDFKYLRVFAFLLLISSSLLASIAQSKPLKIAIESWPPYSGTDLPDQGIATKIVLTALERAGYQSNVQIEVWTRILKGAEVGFYDVIATIWRTDEREKQFMLSEPYLENEVVLISLAKNKIPFYRLSDLHGLVIGTIGSYAYDDGFLKDQAIIKQPKQRLAQNLRLLMEHKIDLAIADKFLVKYEINKYLPAHSHKFSLLKKPLSSRGLRMAVSKRNKNAQAIINAFNQQIQNMKDDGSLVEMIQTYQY